MLYKIIVGLLAGQASGFMAAPMVSTPSLRTAASPVMQYGAAGSGGLLPVREGAAWGAGPRWAGGLCHDCELCVCLVRVE